MNVLETFYILFKTNADDVKRGMDTVNKVSKDTEEKLKRTNEEASKLGQTFVKMVESGAELAGMVTAFNAIKAGAINQRDYNAQLYTTSTLYKQNAGALKEFAQAAAQMGGSRDSAMGDMIGYAQLAQQRGLKYDPLAQMQAARARYQSLAGSPVAQAQMLTGANAYYQDPGLQMMLKMSNKDFGALMNTTGVRAAGSLTNNQAKNAFDSQAAGRELDSSVGKLTTKIGDGLIPTINNLIGVMSNVASNMGNSFSTAIYTAAALIAGKGLIGGGLGRALAGSLLRGGVTTAAGEAGVAGVAGAGIAGVGALATGGALAAIGGVTVGAITYDAYKIKQIIDAYKAMRARQAAGGSSSGGNDMDFFMQQGYSKGQSAGIVANMMKESGGNPNAVGDGGHARGLFQWHKGRRDAILHGTGIDVWNSSKADQMKAALWEMQHGNTGFNDKAFRSMQGAATAGAYFSTNFERPAGGMNEAMLRGQSALSLASGYRAPVTVGTANISIGAININAPGSDAAQIAQHIKAETRKQLSVIQAQADNGRSG